MRAGILGRCPLWGRIGSTFARQRSALSLCHCGRTEPIRHIERVNRYVEGIKNLVAATIEKHQPDSYQLTVDEALNELGGDAQHGLSESEARVRLKEYGKNEIATEEPAPAWRKFVAQFQNVLVILLLIATAISAALWFYEGGWR
jgi:magnesium-transporting ATPase (P-type)